MDQGGGQEQAKGGGAGEGTGPAPNALTGDPLWDDWTVPPRVPAVPALHLDGFDGPIDLLLDLAEHQRIDLGRVSIVDLAEQFVAALARLAAHVPIERRADWVVMASRLVLLRSRLLFPASPEEAAEAARMRPPSCAACARWRSCAPPGPGCRRGRSSGSRCSPGRTRSRRARAATSR